MATLSELVSKTTEIKNDLATCHERLKTNLTGKGVTVSSSDKMLTLINKINDIKVGFQLPMTVPTYTVNIGTITATCNTQAGLFKQFKLNNGSWQTSNVFSNLNPTTSYTYYGKTDDGYTASITTSTPKANQAKPAVPTESNKTHSSVTITAASGCKIRFNGTLYNSPYNFTGLSVSETHRFYSVKEGTSSLNEAVSDALAISLVAPIPGPSNITIGDSHEGLYGPCNGIMTGQQLVSVTGLTNGNLLVSGDIGWNKFSYKGKMIFIADRMIISRLTWNDLNSAGLVKGKEHVIGGRKYLIRVFNQSSLYEGEYSDTIIDFYNNIDYYAKPSWGLAYGNSDAVLCGFNSRYDSVTYASKHYLDSNYGYTPVLEYLGLA